MKIQLPKEDQRLLTLLLEKAKAFESEFAGPQGFRTGPRFESALAELLALFQGLAFSDHPAVQKQAELADHLHPQMTPRHFLNFLLPIERLLDRNVADPEILVTTLDREPGLGANTPRQPLTLVPDHLRSAFNVGSIFRMAETLLVEEIHLCGYTPGPESDGVRKTAMGTELLTPSRHFERVDHSLALLRSRGRRIIALETNPKAKSLYDDSLPDSCALVVGNERFGLDYHVLQLCDETRAIPLIGSKNSLNVASALSVASFEWHRQKLKG